MEDMHRARYVGGSAASMISRAAVLPTYPRAYQSSSSSVWFKVSIGLNM